MRRCWAVTMPAVNSGKLRSPRIARDALAGVGAGDRRELAFERRGKRDAVLHPSHALRIDSVVLGMGAEEPDRQGSCPVLEGCNQSIVVALDVENDPSGLENTR